MCPLPSEPVLIASATLSGPVLRDAVVVCGSHGGIYPAALAACAGVRAIIFSDAGVGRDGAGVAGLELLQRAGTAAATVSHLSARIGDPEDILACGVISQANAAARALGVDAGLPCRQAARLLREAAPGRAADSAPDEHRIELDRASPAARRIVLLDSAASVDPVGDRGALVVTGSHGGLVGGDPARALGTEGYAAVFNDAGVGKERAGVGRLAALDARRIAAFTVAADSASIGSGRSTFEHGRVSYANRAAQLLGIHQGEPAREVILRWAMAGL